MFRILFDLTKYRPPATNTTAKTAETVFATVPVFGNSGPRFGIDTPQVLFFLYT